ncbi:MAG: restriction endonuclease subunit S [Acidobacteriota bacterium]|nr:MAG: restriction endonuclease subunit S [Acidobacteriota bacterium]
MVSLREIAAIRSGYLFRGRLEPDPRGQYRIVQIGDINKDACRLPFDNLTRVDLPDINPNHKIEEGDVLFISRGGRKQAIAQTEPLENTIATSQIFVIKPDQTVLPEYLAWYLNQKPAQRYIDEHSTGTNVSLINIESLGGMPVEIPSIERQRQTVELYRLSLREKEIIERIQEKRRILVEEILLKSIRTSESAR